MTWTKVDTLPVDCFWSNGERLEPLLAFEDGHGGQLVVVEDDHQFVTAVRQKDSTFKATHWTPSEVIKAVAELLAASEQVPFIAIGNEELKDNPVVHAGMRIRCPHCKQAHELHGGKTDKGIETELLLFYKCPKENNSYLAAVDNKLIGRLELEVVA